jgi:hypothetical protein
MITATDRMYYIDPVQDPSMTSTEVYVLREKYPRTFNSHAGTITKVVGRVYDDGHLWWKTEDGVHVDGAPVSPKEIVSYVPTMGILNDDVFVVGEGYGTQDADGDHPRVLIRSAVRSDGKRLATPGGGTVSSYPVTRWVKAAPWAVELMPSVRDSAESVERKVAAAKERFRRRAAEVVILREAIVRDWTDDLPSLGDHGYEGMPSATFSLHVTADVLVPTGDPVPVTDLPEETRAAMEAVRAKSLAGSAVPTRTRQRVEVPADFLVRTAVTSMEEIQAVPRQSIISAAYAQLGYGVELGAYTARPVLRTAV